MAPDFSSNEVMEATGARLVRRGAISAFSGVCTDTRQLSPGCLFVALVGERFDAHGFLTQASAGGAAGAVVAKGKVLPPVPESMALFEVDDTLVALGALGRHHRRRFTLPLGAVTGSNGKTTTKEMVAAILATRGPVLKTKGNLNNEVGVPLTLFGLGPEHRAAIVEMGMNHRGEIDRLTRMAEPDAGLITVVQPAHLMGLGSIEGVAAAKGELFHALRPGATAVVNLDDARIAAQARALPASSGIRQLTFGRASGADVRLEGVESLGREGMRLTVSHGGQRQTFRMGFVGEHNALNATGAFALGLALGYSAEECARGLSSAAPHERRLNVVEAPGGVTVLDDCYNANPASMVAGLETLATLSKGGRAVAVVGDMLELGEDEAREHRSLGEEVARRAKVAAFFGPRSKDGFQAASASMGDRAGHFVEVEPLVSWLEGQLLPGDWVLVKGSRGMKLERVVEALTGVASNAGGAH